MRSLKATLDEKRKKLKSIRGQERMEHNKFLTNFNQEESDNETKEENKADCSYSFGTKCYYWKWYKDNNDEDKIFHPGDTYANWYIDAKYDSLKEEIITAIKNIDLFNDTLQKAKYMLETSQILKEMKCRNGRYDTELNKRYDVAIDTPLSYSHLMSIMFYTDYTKLSYQFSLSFRKKSFDESIQILKTRHAKYYHWAKLLNETVSLFGNRLNYEGIDIMTGQIDPKTSDPQISVLYHGVSFMYFDSFITRFISPTSTTISFGVATIFASMSDNGIILSIEQKGGMEEMYPYYFNCSLVSRFASEDERMFVGGNGDAAYGREGLLEFKSIRLINEQKNLEPFIRALSLFSIVINGQGYCDEDKYAKSIKYYYKLICVLLKEIRDDEANKCPHYIKACFKKLLDSRKYVKINLFGMQNYAEFKPLFLSSEVENVVRIEYICQLFENCTKIVCYMHFYQISIFFVKQLIKILKTIGNDKSNKLREIVFESYGFKGAKIDLNKCQSLFNTELNGSWNVNHIDTFTGVGCWNGECNGLQIIYNQDCIKSKIVDPEKSDGNEGGQLFTLSKPPNPKNKKKRKKLNK